MIERVVVSHNNEALHVLVDGKWHCTNGNWVKTNFPVQMDHSDADIKMWPALVLDWKAEDKRVQQGDIEAISTQYNAMRGLWVTEVYFTNGAVWNSNERPLGEDY